VEGVSGGKFVEEVQRAESFIRRRLPIGSSTTEDRLKKELLSQEFSQNAINRAIYLLIQKEVLAHSDRRLKIMRIRA
jgi:DNA replication licensing factor MCM5